MDILFDIPVFAMMQTHACAALAALGCLLAWASAVDIRQRIIPNAAIVAGVCIWIAVFAATAAADLGVSDVFQSSDSAWLGFRGGDAVGESPLFSLFDSPHADPAASCDSVSLSWERGVASGVVGAFASGGFALLCELLLSHACRKEALGMGDVKLLFVLGLYCGAIGALTCLFIACLLASAYSCVRFALDAAKHVIASAPVSRAAGAFGGTRSGCRFKTRSEARTVASPIEGPACIPQDGRASRARPSRPSFDGTFPFAPFITLSCLMFLLYEGCFA